MCFVTLTATSDGIPSKVMIGISANERFISAYGYTWKFSCSLLDCSCIEANEALVTVSILECCHKTFL